MAEKTFPVIFGNEMQMSKKHTKQIKKRSIKAEGLDILYVTKYVESLPEAEGFFCKPFFKQ